jgi:cytochrome b subunit of formate dehydrogenase
LVSRGETDAPVCTGCHGEHGILSPDDPRSPVSRSKVAELTCSPCHESTVLNEKYGLKTDRLTTFIDSYHGLKSRAGDTHVANCASCHGVHRILASTDSTSTIHPNNLQTTCGECHPSISTKMAATPIHGVSGIGLRTPVADIVERIYIVAIFIIIGLMVLHWLIDLGRQLKNLFQSRPQVRRMRASEIWQHMLLAVTFIILVLSGFALRFDQSGFAKLFFGWDRGFEIRGVVHRIAATVFMFTVVWHLVYLFTLRGRIFVRDMMPVRLDFKFFFDRIMYNLGRRKRTPRFERFSYVEKAEYWALVWGTVVMVITGLMLWFDNRIIQYLPKGVLDVALVIHYWEAWLATLAILVWHLYSTVFNPHVYPMNPSWLTGMMPEKMYQHEHPAHLEEARQETGQMIKDQIAKVSEFDSDEFDGPPPDKRSSGL